MVNGAIDQSYKIINPVIKVLNLPPDDEVGIWMEISGCNDFDSQPSEFNCSNITTPIVTTPILNTTGTPKHFSDGIKTQIKLLEDKMLSKITALKPHLFNYIFDLRNDITLLDENSGATTKRSYWLRKTNCTTSTY